MKNSIFLVTFLGLLFCSCENSKKEETHVAIDSQTAVDPVKRGEYLVSTIGCTDCHTPKVMTPNGPQPDMTRLLSGYSQEEKLPPYDAETGKAYILFNHSLTAAIGPWGTSFSANLTPDETGIGDWTDEQFIRALKEGQWKGLVGSRKLLPPMPWEQYAKIPDEDVLAIFAYLKTLKPVKNDVPQPLPPVVSN